MKIFLQSLFYLSYLVVNHFFHDFKQNLLNGLGKFFLNYPFQGCFQLILGDLT